MAQPNPDPDTVALILAQATRATDWWDYEYRVNAAWNAIFQDRTIFPVHQNGGGPGRVLVNPEAYPNWTDTNGQRNDLLVTKATPVRQNGQLIGFDETRILCYEGKGRTSADNWEKIRTQLQAFIQAVVGTRESSTCWGIGAKGRLVRFWRYQAKNPKPGMQKGTGECMVPLFVANNVIGDNNNNSGNLDRGLYNVSQDWADISRILTKMATEAPTPQGN